MHLAAIILEFTKINLIYNNYYSTPSVKKSGFGLSHGNLLVYTFFIADPDLARICVQSIIQYCLL